MTLHHPFSGSGFEGDGVGVGVVDIVTGATVSHRSRRMPTGSLDLDTHALPAAIAAPELFGTS